MSDVAWGSNAPTFPRVDIAKVPPDVYCRIIGPSALVIANLEIHWVGASSKPHMAENCPWCEYERRWVAYAPVELFQRAGHKTVSANASHYTVPVLGGGKQGILQIGEYMSRLLDGDWSDRIIHVFRRGDHRRGILRFGELEQAPGAGSGYWDVRPHLYRIWGLTHLLPKRQPAAVPSCGQPAIVPTRPEETIPPGTKRRRKRRRLSDQERYADLFPDPAMSE